MICYKDKTFCDFEDCKNYGKCERSFTEEEKKKAEEWWGNDNPPICFYREKPDCFEMEEDEHTKNL